MSAFGEALAAQDAAELDAVRERAEQGDAEAQLSLGNMYRFGTGGVQRDYAEALRWYKRAAGQGNASARLNVGSMYYEGIGVEIDYAEAARWYGCPVPSEEILDGCGSISYNDLPPGARALLKKMNCRVGPGTSYDYGSAVDLNADGSLEYQVCCDYPAHGPCFAVLIGKIGSQWKELGRLRGYSAPCNLLVVLKSRRGGFHDICLPNECSSVSRETCDPVILSFREGGYRAVRSPATKTPK